MLTNKPSAWCKSGTGTRDPPQSLKVAPKDPLQNLEVGSQDVAQSLKVGPLHFPLMNSFFSEYFIVFFTYLFLYLFYIRYKKILAVSN